MIFRKGNIEMQVDNYEVLSVTQYKDGTVSVQARLTNDNSAIVQRFDGMITEQNYCNDQRVMAFMNEELSEDQGD